MAWSNRNLFNARFNAELNSEDAYVSGYFGVAFKIKADVLSYITNSTNQNAYNKHNWDAINATDMLSSLCEGVTTVPGGTLNVAEITAMGGAKWGAPSNIDFGDQITLKFRELSNMPLKRFIVGWANLVRNTNTAMSEVVRNGSIASVDYTKMNFNAELLYWTLKPNGRTVEFAASFHGVYPLSDLSSQITTDYETVDGQTFDVNFHIDDMRWDYKTVETCQNLVDRFYNSGVNEYYTHNS